MRVREALFEFSTAPSMNSQAMPVYEVTDIHRYFNTRTLQRAQGIVRNGGVLQLGWDAEEQMVMGVVQGTAKEPYITTIEFDDGEFSAYCSCPVGFDCKHAAACLLELAQNETSQSTSLPAVAEPQVSSIETWTQRLTSYQRQLQRHQEGSFRSSYDCVLFSLEPRVENGAGAHSVALRIYNAKISDNGRFSKGRLYKIGSFRDYHGAGFTRDDNLLIDTVRAMTKHAGNDNGYELAEPYNIEGHLGAAAMQQLMNTTGRVFLDNDREAPMVYGEAKVLHITWEPTEDASRLSLKLTINGMEHWHPVFTDPPWYIDVAGKSAGPLQTDIDAGLLPILFDAPSVPVESAQALANELSLSLPSDAVPLPATPNIRKLDDELEPVILMHSPQGSPDINQWVVACLMKYGDHDLTVDFHQTDTHTRITDDSGADVVITRDHASEYDYYRRFQFLLSSFEPCLARDQSLYRSGDHQPVRRDVHGRLEAFEQLFARIGQLEDEGFTVSVHPPVGVSVERVSRLSASLKGAESGWFELGLVLEHHGVRYQLLPLVVEWLERTGGDAPLRWQGDDGQWLEAPEEILRPVVETLRELLDDERTDSFKVPRARALSLSYLKEELEGAEIETEWQDDARLFELADTLRNFGSDTQTSIESALPPDGLQIELRPYQLLGMGWLNFLSEAGLNGILADDMGLGKTAQTLAHFQFLVNCSARRHKKNRNGPFLVVAPTSLLGNWAREVERFTPRLRVRIWHGSERHIQPLTDETADIIVTSYALALRDHDLLCEHGFKMLVLDEAQTIKNPNAKITQTLKTMPIERRLCLTGTPMENHLGELWSLFDFLMPGLLGSQKRFSRHFRTPIEKHGETARQRRLNAVVQPFMLRRRKEQVATELPEKTEIIQTITLNDNQAKLYEGIRLAMQARVKKLLKDRGLARSHIEMLDALLKLRQTCCHPQLVKLPAARRVTESAKTQYVLEMIEELVSEGRKILLFSQFTEMLGLLEVELTKRKINYVKLTGRTRKRDVVIDTFQSGEVPLFLISLKAGGTGLNLTAADTVIHYDPWWNPAVEQQATARAHRIGQDKPVFVYKLVVKDTVEEKIVAMQSRKQALADATLEKQDGETFTAFSADDILSLFE